MSRQIFISLVILAFQACQAPAANPPTNDQQRKIDSLTMVLAATKGRQNESKPKQVSFKSERNDLFQKVTTDQPAFIAAALGGIANIHFNLFNDYKYRLDQVILKVHYLRPNGTEVHNETLIETDIAPNSHRALTAPDYAIAGKMVSVSIESVLCHAIDLCYYGNGDSVASSDPYKCRE